MNKKTKIVFSALFIAISLNAGFMDMIKDNVKNLSDVQKVSKTSTSSDSQIAAGLKEALKVGIKESVSMLGKEGGFLNNPAYKIPLPKNLQKAETILRKAGAGKYADELVASINHAAEKAVPKTADIFMNAVSSMSFEDAQKILQGGDNAATEYFKEKTYDKLKKAIEPIVKESMKKSSVATYYKTFNEYYSKYAGNLVNNSQVASMAKNLGFGNYLPSSSAKDLEGYVTEQTINRLFQAISQKEKLIRENPAFRTTDLLKKVFGK